MIELGQDFLKNGDFSSARLLLQRAAKAGSAAAALSLGETFDPFLIQRLGAIGVQPDVAKRANGISEQRNLARIQRQNTWQNS